MRRPLHNLSFPNARFRRGILLIEALITIGLLSVVALISARVYTTGMRLVRDSQQSALSIERFDAALSQLRRDAWGAKTIRVSNPHGVTLDIAGPSATTVTWTIKGDELQRSTSDNTPPQVWPRLSSDLTFAADGPALLVRVPDARDRRGGEIHLLSQMLLLVSPGGPKP